MDELFKPSHQEVMSFEDAKSKLTPRCDAIIDMTQLIDRLKSTDKIVVEKDVTTNKRILKGRDKEKQKDEFFKMLSKELHYLARKYEKTMDDIHMLFMEVSCDLEELKKALSGESSNRWEFLEDLAIQNKNSQPELDHLTKTKGEQQINKRKKFLELPQE